MSKAERKRYQWGMVACTAAVVLAVALGIGYGLWRALVQVSPKVLAGALLAVVAALPVVAALAYKGGHMHSQGVLSGLVLGLGTATKSATEVLRVGSQAAEAKASTTRALRAAVTPVALPEVVLIGEGKDGGEAVYL